MEPRDLTGRERGVLGALLAVDDPRVVALRAEADGVRVVSVCGCGCPSIDFASTELGMSVLVNAGVRSDQNGGLFLYTVGTPDGGERLGGIEWCGVVDPPPAEFPPPDDLDVSLADPPPAPGKA